jgi:hypothetical protein
MQDRSRIACLSCILHPAFVPVFILRAGARSHMIRKSLFSGLTLVLAVALVTLIIRGRKLEKQRAVQSVEVVQQSRPTATRVLMPRDLEVLNPTMQMESGHSALHGLEIRNSGRVPYNRIQLRFAYLDRDRRTVATKTHSVERVIASGASIKLTDISIEKFPSSAALIQVSIVYADIGALPSQD